MIIKKITSYFLYTNYWLVGELKLKRPSCFQTIERDTHKNRKAIEHEKLIEIKGSAYPFDLANFGIGKFSSTQSVCSWPRDEDRKTQEIKPHRLIHFSRRSPS